MENWKIVRGENNSILVKGQNIVLQSVLNNDIGYIENTSANRILLGINSNEMVVEDMSYNNCEDTIDETESDIENIPMVEDTWDLNKTKQLLTLYLERKDKFRNPKVKKKSLWNEISTQVGIGSEDCDKKFRNMKQTYIRLLKNKKKSGRGAVSWVFFNIFDEIFASDTNVHPCREVKILDTLNTSEQTLKKSDFSRNVNPIESLENMPAACSSRVIAADNQVEKSPAFKNRRYDDARKATTEIKERQRMIENKFDKLISVVEESNMIQKERNKLFESYLEQNSRKN